MVAWLNVIFGKKRLSKVAPKFLVHSVMIIEPPKFMVRVSKQLWDDYISINYDSYSANKMFAADVNMFIVNITGVDRYCAVRKIEVKPVESSAW